MPTSIKSKNDLLELIINLRATILTLGETADSPWWRTEFMNETGFRFLERIFPRSYFQAALNSAGKAARDAHDRSTGKVGVYHLFRLPEGLEAAIHTHLTTLNGDLSAEYRELFTEKSTLLGRLKSLSGKEHVADEPIAGALRIGNESDCKKVESYQKAAAVYYNAFQNGKQSFPYFAEGGNSK